MTPDTKSLIERMPEADDAQGLRNLAEVYADEIGKRFVALLNRTADRLEALNAPVEMETTAKERAIWRRSGGDASSPFRRLIRDADKAARLAAQLAAENERADDNYDEAQKALRELSFERARAEKALAALKDDAEMFRDLGRPDLARCGEAILDAALEKKP